MKTEKYNILDILIVLDSKLLSEYLLNNYIHKKSYKFETIIYDKMTFKDTLIYFYGKNYYIDTCFDIMYNEYNEPVCFINYFILKDNKKDIIFITNTKTKEYRDIIYQVPEYRKFINKTSKIYNIIKLNKKYRMFNKYDLLKYLDSFMIKSLDVYDFFIMDNKYDEILVFDRFLSEWVKNSNNKLISDNNIYLISDGDIEVTCKE